MHPRPFRRSWHAQRAWPVAAAALLLGALAVGGVQLQRSAAQGQAHSRAALLAPDVCVVAPPTPFDPRAGLPMAAARAVPAAARCPVCGMYPARAPGWAAQVIFANGDAHFFDSPVSLFLYLGDVPRYSPGRTGADIVARYVTDSDSGAWLQADTAWYVHGSSALGPMRAGNLPAFASAAAAERFAAARGGQALAPHAIDAQLLRSLGGGGAHHTGH